MLYLCRLNFLTYNNVKNISYLWFVFRLLTKLSKLNFNVRNNFSSENYNVSEMVAYNR